jgi:hypothetical protein
MLRRASAPARPRTAGIIGARMSDERSRREMSPPARSSGEPDASPLMRPVRLCPAQGGAPRTIALGPNECKRFEIKT